MTSVPPTLGTRRRSRVPAAARLTGRPALAALVAALVMGILGMHALASHGSPAAPAAPAVAAGSSSAASMTGMSSAHDGDVHPAASDSSMAAAGSSVTTGSGAGHGMAGMVMLCVVMLAAGGLTWLVLLVAGIFRPLLPAAFWPAVVREEPLPWARGSGPPYVWQFSVIRC